MAVKTRSAYAAFAEHQRSTIAPGMLADLAVLSQDIFTVPVEALPATTSVLTMVDGRVLHDARVPAAGGPAPGATDRSGEDDH